MDIEAVSLPWLLRMRVAMKWLRKYRSDRYAEFRVYA